MAEARRLAVALALFQVVDAFLNEVAPRRLVQSHLDHLGLPHRLRPALTVIKATSAAGLLLGRRAPALGAITSAGLVSFYSAAVTFHLLAGDHPVVAAPAAACGATAAAVLLQPR